jgi:hypothetical protein
MTGRLYYLTASALLVGGVLEAGRVPDTALRHEAYAMVLTLIAVAVLARPPFLLGPASSLVAVLVRLGGFAIVAADVSGGIEAMRTATHPASIDPAVSIVWTVMLSVHVLAILAVTARRVGVARPALAAGAAAGSATFAVWALLCLLQPDIPQSNAPAVFALALAAVAAIHWSWRRRTTPTHSAAAGLLAATTVALLSGVLIDAGLPHLSRWVSTGAPPIPTIGPNAPHRLVDPVGILMLSTLLAIALATALVAGRARPTANQPDVAPVAAA